MRFVGQSPLILAAALAVALGGPAEARQARSKAVLAEYRKTHACPSSGLFKGPCAGFQLDHRVPLCMGGPDRASNIHWISVEEHRAKTVLDNAQCRLNRRYHQSH